MHTLNLLLLLATVAYAVGEQPPREAPARRLDRYNVVWNSPSKDASGAMPFGNGDVAGVVYAIENGDLFLLLSKNDAYNYMGDLYKTGRVRVSLTPNPFKAGTRFRQTLDLATGAIRIEADGITLRIWADALRPVYHVEIDSPQELAVVAQPEFWKRIASCAHNDAAGYSPPKSDPPQDVRVDRSNSILWYYAVGDNSVFGDDLKFYAVESMEGKFPDPFRFNIFGNLLESSELALREGALRGSGKRFDLRIHGLAMQTADAETWIKAIEQQAARRGETRRDWEKHCAWWTEFWNRGWILASDRAIPAEAREQLKGEVSPAGLREEADGAAVVAQSYNVFRFLMACQSRGRVQTKFNGGLFTQQFLLKADPNPNRPHATDLGNGILLTHEDERLWGRRFTYQNQRLLYWPMLANGDFDLMKPFFNYYWDLLPMRRAITQAWFGHEGAYYRENIEPTGAERDCGNGGRPPKTKPGEKYTGWYHDYYFTSGLETLAMMLDYIDFTGDQTFREHVMVPFAREVLLFFEKHYPRGDDGKLRLEPAQVLETWWVAVNPAPDIAGLRFCLQELLLTKAGTDADQAHWRSFLDEVPGIPMQTVEGRQAIAPALTWEKRANAENGELYPVFPFRFYGVAFGSGGLVDWTMKQRSTKDTFGCWNQDQIGWACAGNAAEAARGLVSRFRTASTMCRFPMYGREGPDSCPDFDHFGSGSVALQRMLVQETRDKIVLLPAWPANWDADFKLHLARGTVIRGTVKDGKLTSWEIEPRSRRKDVSVCEPQAKSEPGAP